MTNKKLKVKKTFKEVLKEYWEDYKWMFYVMIFGYVCVWCYAIIELIFMK